MLALQLITASVLHYGGPAHRQHPHMLQQCACFLLGSLVEHAAFSWSLISVDNNGLGDGHAAGDLLALLHLTAARDSAPLPEAYCAYFFYLCAVSLNFKGHKVVRNGQW